MPHTNSPGPAYSILLERLQRFTLALVRGHFENGIALLKEQGHTVEPCNCEGAFWFEIDGRMFASTKKWQNWRTACTHLNN